MIDLLKLIKVNSSMISDIGYDESKKMVVVKFKNGIMWKYGGVDQKEYDRFKNAKSIGKFFHKNIKTKDGEKIEDV